MKITIAALAATAALAVAGNAGATVYAGDAEGVFTSGVPPQHDLGWTGPMIQAGDALSIVWTFNDAKCDMVGGVCFGGAGSPGALHQRPAEATISVDGWSQTISGFEYQVDSLDGLHVEDAYLTLDLTDTSLAGPAGGGHLTWDAGTPFQMNFAFDHFDPEPISPVPEPAVWAMMLAGLGMAGGALRSRRLYASKVPALNVR